MPHRASLTRAQIDLTPGRPSLARSGEPPPLESVAGESRCRPACPFAQGRPIADLRPRLDQPGVKQVGYRSAFAFLHMSPSVLYNSTRGPI